MNGSHEPVKLLTLAEPADPIPFFLSLLCPVIYEYVRTTVYRLHNFWRKEREREKKLFKRTKGWGETGTAASMRARTDTHVSSQILELVIIGIGY